MIGKSERISNIVNHLQTKYGADNILIQDHWETDENAIGLTDKSNQYLGYISTISDIDDNYYLALENPPVDNSFPYSDAGDYDNISLMELENILAKHLRLIN
jgi:hypothetical protein